MRVIVEGRNYAYTFILESNPVNFEFLLYTCKFGLDPEFFCLLKNLRLPTSISNFLSPF